jgi:N-methylhydantoinase A
VLGILNEKFFLAGKIPIHRDLAARALKEKIGTQLRLTPEEAALGVFEVQNAQAADLVRKTVVEAGYDPRDFVMYAFGGAGPVHCSAYGADLGIPYTVVPLGSTASAFSAFGLASSDIVITAELSDPSNYPVQASKINSIFKNLEESVQARLASQGIQFESVQTQREIDIRYSLQITEVWTPVKEGQLNPADVSEILTDFEAVYEKLYGKGTGFREAGFQFITYRVRGRGNLPLKPRLPEIPQTIGGSLDQALKGRRPVMLDKRGFRETPIFDYTLLRSGHMIQGPAIVEAPTTTVVIPESASGHVDRLGNIIIRHSLDSKEIPE